MQWQGDMSLQRFSNVRMNNSLYNLSQYYNRFPNRKYTAKLSYCADPDRPHYVHDGPNFVSFLEAFLFNHFSHDSSPGKEVAAASFLAFFPWGICAYVKSFAFGFVCVRYP